jgi:hypothetical protein
MQGNHGHIVLVTGDAPYLGGALTWAPLRHAAPEFEFVEVDILNVSEAASLFVAARASIIRALQGARAIVAHGTAATIAVEAVSLVDPSIPVLLLSPRIITRMSLPLRLIRTIVGGGLGASMLTAFARSKHRRLLTDQSYIRKQLKLLVRDDVISDELLREASRRIADSRTEIAVRRTSEILRSVLTPIDAQANEAVLHRAVLIGSGPLDRKSRAQGEAIVIDGAWSAPMLETPNAVAEHLRTLVGPNK